MNRSNGADKAATLASARRAMSAILRLDILPEHKRELLGICLWKVTEAGGTKYRIRYRSVASRGLPRSELQHEHVFQRQTLVARLLEDPRCLDDVIATAVACVVTRAEHRRLDAIGRERPRLDGWARYRAAGIVVEDTETGRLKIRGPRARKPARVSSARRSSAAEGS